MNHQHVTFIPVANEAAGGQVCDGCVFSDRRTYMVSDCHAHACFPEDFPEGHHLREARNIIWVRPQ